MTDVGARHSRRYRRKLLFLVSAATFFEGYDNFVLSFVLALVLGDLGASEAQAGWVRAVTSVGTIVAFGLAAQADRIGRRLLLITIVVEEFPTHGRGRALGIVTSRNTLGGIFVGVLAFVGLQETPLSWRAFFVVNLIPLVVIAVARRSLLETERYEAVRTDPRSERLDHTSVWEPWRPEYRRDVLSIGLLTFFRHAAVAAGAFWWAYYAQQEAGMSVSLSGLYLAIAGVLGAVGFVAGGRLMDRIGRRRAFLLYMLGTLVFGTWVFQVRSAGPMLPTLCAAIFFGLGSVCMTSAWSTEPFPTYVRSRAAAWCRNAFEVPGPEAVVERWLLALNQGAAGRPGAYADASVSERLFPGSRERDPGVLDVIEVGRGAPNEGSTYVVPFRVVTVDGTAFRGTATLVDGRVVDVERRPVLDAFPSEGGPPIAGAGTAAWPASVAIALLMIAATAGVMALAPVRGRIGRYAP